MVIEIRWVEECEMCGVATDGNYIPDGELGVCEDCYNLKTFHPELLAEVLQSRKKHAMGDLDPSK